MSKGYYFSDLFWTAVFSIVGITLVYTIAGCFDDSFKELNIDKDKLASNYVKGFYPEFQNCTMEYSECLNEFVSCEEGVEVYCFNATLENRDSLEVHKEKPKITTSIKFNGITLEKILKNKIEALENEK